MCRILFSLFIGLSLLNLNAFALNSFSFAIRDSAKLAGYTGITYSDSSFVAVGSDGRIDRISLAGKITHSEKISNEGFNCILALDSQIFVAGNRGAIMVSSDKGPFIKINSGTVNNINSLTLFQGKVVAGTDAGELLIGINDTTFNKITLNVKGNIVSVSAGESACYGATDQGEIISSSDGVDWNVFDFNSVYSGFYKPCRFTKILAAKYNIAVTGIYEDGSPVLMFSTQGNVWTERTLNYNDIQAAQVPLSDAPNDIFYDSQRDLFYLACNNGKIMSIPSCAHCNKAAILTSENLTTLWCKGDILMVAGTNFYIEAITPQ